MFSDSSGQAYQWRFEITNKYLYWSSKLLEGSSSRRPCFISTLIGFVRYCGRSWFQLPIISFSEHQKNLCKIKIKYIWIVIILWTGYPYKIHKIKIRKRSHKNNFLIVNYKVENYCWSRNLKQWNQCLVALAENVQIKLN